MALGRIYIGNTLFMDGKAIADAIGSEAANALTFTALANFITTDKQTLADNLVAKGIVAIGTETLEDLAAKVADVSSGDLGAIRTAIGSEVPNNANTQEIADIITADKTSLIGFLDLYGLTGQSVSTTLSTLINQLVNINATRYYQLTENFNMSDYVTALNSLLSNFVDTAVIDLLTPQNNPVTEDMSDISGLSNLGIVTDSVEYQFLSVLGYKMSSNTTTTGSALSDIMSPMTSNTSIDGTASASSNYDAYPLYQTWKAFDGNLLGNADASGGWVTASMVVTGWLQFQFNSAQVVKQYNVIGWRYDASLPLVQQSFPKDWTFEGSNDGTSWDILDTQTSQSVSTQAQVKTYPITNTATYFYYRLNITANNGYGGYTAITQLQLFNTVPTIRVFYSSASSYYSASYEAWKAFNRSTTSYDAWITSNGNVTGWLKYQLDTADVANYYEVYPMNESTGISSYPKDWSFEGSNDGTSWDILDTQTSQSVSNYTSDSNSYAITNTTAYLYYRLNITANNGNTSYTSVGELILINT